MSWRGINHPSELLKIDQAKIEVKIFLSDRKRKDRPGPQAEGIQPLGQYRTALCRSARFTMRKWSTSCPTGAFAGCRKASRGWLHISEMSWTKRINHPSEVVTQNQKVKVKVLEINKEKQEISLGMKQVGENPWERVAERYPPGSWSKARSAILPIMERLLR